MIEGALQKALHLFFPSFCLHCKELASDGKLFCSSCTEQLALIDPVGRCRLCFIETESSVCLNCRKEPAGVRHMAAACEGWGSARTMLQEMKKGNYPRLITDAASLMIIQLHRLGWPFPDCIVPIPSPTLMQFMAPPLSHALAKQLGKMLDRPVLSLLARDPGDPPRKHLADSDLSLFSFRIRSPVDFSDKIILLIDDLIYTGSTLKAAAKTLRAGCPSATYGLAFCRS